MKYTLLIASLFFMLAGCKKDKFTTAPQISFVDIKPNFAPMGLTNVFPELIPKLIFDITDAEGDFGSSIDPSDSSWIYVKNLVTLSTDSFRFPNLQSASKDNFKAEVSVNMLDAIEFCPIPGGIKPRVDTVFYDVYVRDAKGHKSNVIKTGKPILTECK